MTTCCQDGSHCDSGSMEGLADLGQEDTTILANAVAAITKGTTVGAGTLAAEDPNFNLAKQSENSQRTQPLT